MSDDAAATAADLDHQFADAQARIKPIAGLGNDIMLSLYALFKQASAGDASGARPGMMDLRGRAKFDAWAKHKGTSKDAAKRAYIAAVDNILSERK